MQFKKIYSGNSPSRFKVWWISSVIEPFTSLWFFKPENIIRRSIINFEP